MRLLVILFALFFSGVAHAQCHGPNFGPPFGPLQETQVSPEEIVDVAPMPPQRGQVRKNIHILYDQSGSMKKPHIARALNTVNQIICQNFDEFNVKVTVFAGEKNTLVPTAEQGFDLAKDPTWMKMPSGNNLNKTIEFVSDVKIPTGSTNINAAMRSALLDQTEDLTIIVISDTIIDDRTTMEETIRELQAGRREAGIGEASIGFVCVADSGNYNHYVIQTVYQMAKRYTWFWMNMQ